MIGITAERPVGPGSTITNGSSALRITERVELDPRWKAPGWRGWNIGLEKFDGNTGTTSFISDNLLSDWHHVPFEWTPVTGGCGLEVRYTWSLDHQRLCREFRTLPLQSCDREPPKCAACPNRGVNLIVRDAS